MIISSSEFYHFPSLFHLYPNADKDNIGTQIAETLCSTLVTFHVKKAFHANEIMLVGSGFLVDLGGVVFVATASHVMDNFSEYEKNTKTEGLICVQGDYYRLNFDVEIFRDKQQDYAFFKVPQEIQNRECFEYLTTKNRNSFIPTSTFMVLGYPANKNKSRREESWEMNSLNIIFHSFDFDTQTEDIFFPFDTSRKGLAKHRVESQSTFTFSSLEGMSGCPVIQLMVKEKNYPFIVFEKTYQFIPKAVGIFKEHKKRPSKYLSACSFVPFADEVNSLICEIGMKEN